jgi:energy-coupling factor transporter ATP-binding protein EcfA2
MRSNPFVGLRPFEAADTHLFFGRDRQVDELLARLRTQRFVAVLGSSGSGKSSLVRAGLLPALEGGMLGTGGASWRVAILRPGGDPIGHLAAALDRAGAWRSEANAGVASHAILEAVLRRGSLGLADAVDEAGLRPDDAVLIVVDQFEELFRFKRVAPTAADDAAAFVKLLLEASRHASRAIHVVLTMRSEFLGNCAEFRELPEAINDGLFLIPRLTRDQLAQAITGPIAVAGARIAPSLVQRLLNDVGDDPDQLPVLQHVLMRMWDRRNGSATLTIDHLQAVKGMSEALSDHADEAYRELDESRKQIAENAFRCLTERGTDGRDVRRPLPLSELADSVGASVDSLVHVIDRFRQEGRSFLTPPPSQPLLADTVIDISHESLMRKWKRLRAWVSQEAEDRRVYLRVAESAEGHATGQEPLWREPRLVWADQWRRRFQPTEGWARRYAPGLDQAMAFLDQSLAARRAEDRGRLARRIGLIAFVALIGSLALWAYAERRERLHHAEDVQKEAERRRLKDQLDAEKAMLVQKQEQLDLKTDLLNERERAAEAEARSRRQAVRLADLNAFATPNGAEVAVLVASHALRWAQQDHDSSTKDAAQSALARNLKLLAPIVWRLKPGYPATDLGLSGNRVLTIDTVVGSGSAALSVWDSTPARRGKLEGRELEPRARLARIAGDGRHVVWISDKTAGMWDSASGTTDSMTDASFDRATGIAVSASGATVAVTGATGTWRWDVANRQRLELDKSAYTLLVVSPDGKLVAGVRPGTVRVWNAETGAQMGADLTIAAGPMLPLPPVFSPDGMYAATAAGATVHLWRVGAEPLQIEPMRPGIPIHGQRVNDLAFSPDSKYLATASDDQSAAIVRIDPPRAARVVWVVKHTGSIRQVAFGRGNVLATGSSDNTARVWQRSTDFRNDWSELFRVPHRGEVRRLVLSDDGDLLTEDATGWLQVARVTVPAPDSTASRPEPDPCARVTRNLSGREWVIYFPMQPYEVACPEIYPLEPADLIELMTAQVDAGEGPAASTTVKQLLGLGNLSDVNPRSIVAVAAKFWDKENRVQAAELFRLASDLAVKSGITNQASADLHNHICWEGIIRDLADDVWPACDGAVRLDERNFSFVDSRGVAYALKGDVKNAQAAFEYYVKAAAGQRTAERINRRKGWIDGLKANRNPFGPDLKDATLQALRSSETSLPVVGGR